MLRGCTERPNFFKTRSDNSGCTEGFVHRPKLLEVLQHVVGKLVGGFRTATFGDQSRQSRFLEGGQELVERRPREAKAVGGCRHGKVVDLHAPKHLVLDLHQVARIEELVRQEQLVGHVLGASV